MSDKAYRRVYNTRIRAAAVLYRRRLRVAVILKYGGVCTCCGETQIEFLTIDHTKGGGTVDRNSAGGTWGMYLKILRAPNSRKYQVLCFNCNCGRANNGGICPHKRSKH